MLVGKMSLETSLLKDVKERRLIATGIELSQELSEIGHVCESEDMFIINHKMGSMQKKTRVIIFLHRDSKCVT